MLRANKGKTVLIIEGKDIAGDQPQGAVGGSGKLRHHAVNRVHKTLPWLAQAKEFNGFSDIAAARRGTSANDHRQAARF